MPPEPADTARAGETEANRQLAIDGFLGRIPGRPAAGSDRGLESPDGFGARTGEPCSFRVGLRDRCDEPYVAPGERAVVEGVRGGGQLFERAAHGADLLELAAGDAEGLARVVVDADEAEPEVGRDGGGTAGRGGRGRGDRGPPDGRGDGAADRAARRTGHGPGGGAPGDRAG